MAANFEVFARGIRNTVGFDWDPAHQELWFNDHGRDMMGDDMPSCELNHAPKAGMHFGFPYCHQGDTPDPEYGAKRNCSEFTPPALKQGGHVAPNGLRFYTGKMFPAEYQEPDFHRAARLLESQQEKRLSRDDGHAEQGSARRSTSTKSSPPAGWKTNAPGAGRSTCWSCPTDALLISDDTANAVYRVTYSK